MNAALCAITLLVEISAALLGQAEAPRQASHEMLGSVLWAQTSVEHDAAYEQAYRQARHILDRARRDRTWTAALEQKSGYERLPPAVVLDIDETILDNSPVEAEVVRRGGPFDPNLWDAWIRQQRAAPLPGALEFTLYAAAKGVEVIYLTNRIVREKQATRRTLAQLGFPLRNDVETIYCRGERPDWNSEKSTRRQVIAQRYRILLLIGDDLGDFLPGVRVSPEERRKLAAPYHDRWGERWIILPNPMYGTWEGALYGYEQSLSHADQLRRKRERLRSMKPY